MVRVSQLTPAQKFLLAVSLPITLVFLYFLFRKNNEDDEEEEMELKTATSRHAAIELCVPRDAVGAVIGTQGSQIKEIQEKTKTRITFKGERSRTNEDRVLVIRGNQDGVHQAELMVRKIILDQPPIVADAVSVPREAIGRIIGRNGDTIRMLQRTSKAKIIIEQSESRSANVVVSVQLKGTPAAIDTAKSLIMEKVAEENEFRARSNAASRDANAAQKTLATGSTTTKTDETDLVGDKSQLGSDYAPVYVSAVEHPEHFWIQVISSKSLQLDSLVEQMTNYYGTQNMGDPVTTVKEGDLLAGPFEHDNRWYRVEVAAVENDTVDLYYVDFGDSGFVARDKLRALRNDFTHLPFQATECSLANVQPSEGSEWSSAAIDEFEKLCHVAKWKAVMARVVGSRTASDGTTLPCVQIVDTNGPMDVDVATELINGGHAKSLEDGTKRHSEQPVTNKTDYPDCFSWDAESNEWYIDSSSGVFDATANGERLPSHCSARSGRPDRVVDLCYRSAISTTSASQLSTESRSDVKISESFVIPRGLYEGFCDHFHSELAADVDFGCMTSDQSKHRVTTAEIEAFDVKDELVSESTTLAPLKSHTRLDCVNIMTNDIDKANSEKLARQLKQSSDSLHILESSRSAMQGKDESEVEKLSRDSGRQEVVNLTETESKESAALNVTRKDSCSESLLDGFPSVKCVLQMNSIRNTPEYLTPVEPDNAVLSKLAEDFPVIRECVQIGSIVNASVNNLANSDNDMQKNETPSNNRSEDSCRLSKSIEKDHVQNDRMTYAEIVRKAGGSAEELDKIEAVEVVEPSKEELNVDSSSNSVECCAQQAFIEPLSVSCDENVQCVDNARRELSFNSSANANETIHSQMPEKPLSLDVNRGQSVTDTSVLSEPYLSIEMASERIQESESQSAETDAFAVVISKKSRRRRRRTDSSEVAAEVAENVVDVKLVEVDDVDRPMACANIDTQCRASLPEDDENVLSLVSQADNNEVVVKQLVVVAEDAFGAHAISSVDENDEIHEARSHLTCSTQPPGLSRREESTSPVKMLDGISVHDGQHQQPTVSVDQLQAACDINKQLLDPQLVCRQRPSEAVKTLSGVSDVPSLPAAASAASQEPPLANNSEMNDGCDIVKSYPAVEQLQTMNVIMSALDDSVVDLAGGSSTLAQLAADYPTIRECVQVYNMYNRSSSPSDQHSRQIPSEKNAVQETVAQEEGKYTEEERQRVEKLHQTYADMVRKINSVEAEVEDTNSDLIVLPAESLHPVPEPAATSSCFYETDVDRLHCYYSAIIRLCDVDCGQTRTNRVRDVVKSFNQHINLPFFPKPEECLKCDVENDETESGEAIASEFIVFLSRKQKRQRRRTDSSEADYDESTMQECLQQPISGAQQLHDLEYSSSCVDCMQVEPPVQVPEAIGSTQLVKWSAECPELIPVHGNAEDIDLQEGQQGTAENVVVIDEVESCPHLNESVSCDKCENEISPITLADDSVNVIQSGVNLHTAPLTAENGGQLGCDVAGNISSSHDRDDVEQVTHAHGDDEPKVSRMTYAEKVRMASSALSNCNETNVTDDKAVDLRLQEVATTEDCSDSLMNYIDDAYRQHVFYRALVLLSDSETGHSKFNKVRESVIAFSNQGQGQSVEPPKFSIPESVTNLDQDRTREDVEEAAEDANDTFTVVFSRKQRRIRRRTDSSEVAVSDDGTDIDTVRRSVDDEVNGTCCQRCAVDDADDHEISTVNIEHEQRTVLLSAAEDKHTALNIEFSRQQHQVAVEDECDRVDLKEVNVSGSQGLSHAISDDSYSDDKIVSDQQIVEERDYCNCIVSEKTDCEVLGVDADVTMATVSRNETIQPATEITDVRVTETRDQNNDIVPVEVNNAQNKPNWLTYADMVKQKSNNTSTVDEQSNAVTNSLNPAVSQHFEFEPDSSKQRSLSDCLSNDALRHNSFYRALLVLNDVECGETISTVREAVIAYNQLQLRPPFTEFAEPCTDSADVSVSQESTEAESLSDSFTVVISRKHRRQRRTTESSETGVDDVAQDYSAQCPSVGNANVASVRVCDVSGQYTDDMTGESETGKCLNEICEKVPSFDGISEEQAATKSQSELNDKVSRTVDVGLTEDETKPAEASNNDVANGVFKPSDGNNFTRSSTANGETTSLMENYPTLQQMFTLNHIRSTMSETIHTEPENASLLKLAAEYPTIREIIQVNSIEKNLLAISSSHDGQSVTDGPATGTEIIEDTLKDQKDNTVKDDISRIIDIQVSKCPQYVDDDCCRLTYAAIVKHVNDDVAQPEEPKVQVESAFDDQIDFIADKLQRSDSLLMCHKPSADKHHNYYPAVTLLADLECGQLHLTKSVRKAVVCFNEDMLTHLLDETKTLPVGSDVGTVRTLPDSDIADNESDVFTVVMSRKTKRLRRRTESSGDDVCCENDTDGIRNENNREADASAEVSLKVSEVENLQLLPVFESFPANTFNGKATEQAPLEKSSDSDCRAASLESSDCAHDVIQELANNGKLSTDDSRQTPSDCSRLDHYTAMRTLSSLESGDVITSLLPILPPACDSKDVTLSLNSIVEAGPSSSSIPEISNKLQPASASPDVKLPPSNLALDDKVFNSFYYPAMAALREVETGQIRLKTVSPALTGTNFTDLTATAVTDSPDSAVDLAMDVEFANISDDLAEIQEKDQSNSFRLNSEVEIGYVDTSSFYTSPQSLQSSNEFEEQSKASELLVAADAVDIDSQLTSKPIFKEQDVTGACSFGTYQKTEVTLPETDQLIRELSGSAANVMTVLGSEKTGRQKRTKSKTATDDRQTAHNDYMEITATAQNMASPCNKTSFEEKEVDATLSLSGSVKNELVSSDHQPSDQVFENVSVEQFFAVNSSWAVEPTLSGKPRVALEKDGSGVANWQLSVKSDGDAEKQPQQQSSETSVSGIEQVTDDAVTGNLPHQPTAPTDTEVASCISSSTFPQCVRRGQKRKMKDTRKPNSIVVQESEDEKVTRAPLSSSTEMQAAITPLAPVLATATISEVTDPVYDCTGKALAKVRKRRYPHQKKKLPEIDDASCRQTELDERPDVKLQSARCEDGVSGQVVRDGIVAVDDSLIRHCEVLSAVKSQELTAVVAEEDVKQDLSALHQDLAKLNKGEAVSVPRQVSNIPTAQCAVYSSPAASVRDFLSKIETVPSSDKFPMLSSEADIAILRTQKPGSHDAQHMPNVELNHGDQQQPPRLAKCKKLKTEGTKPASTCSQSSVSSQSSKKAKKRKKRRRTRERKSRSEDEQTYVGSSSLSDLLCEIAAICAPPHSAVDEQICTNSKRLDDAVTVEEKKKPENCSTSMTSHQPRKYRRSRPINLAQISRESDGSKSTALPMQAEESCYVENEDTAVLLAVTACMKTERNVTDNSKSGAVTVQSDENSSERNFSDYQSAEYPVQLEQGRVVSNLLEKVRSIDDAKFEISSRVEATEENKPFTANRLDVYSPEGISTTSDELKSPSPFSNYQNILDQSADTEVELILANSTPSLCVEDGAQHMDGNVTSSTDVNASVEGHHSSSVDSASGTSIESDEIIITNYVDVEFVEETETVTVIESACENVSPASTFGCDDEGSHFADIPDLEYDGPLPTDNSPTASERPRLQQQQEAADKDLKAVADVVIARHSIAPDDVATLPKNDDVDATQQQTVKSAMFYPQWLNKGSGGNAATGLPKSLITESRKRLHSSNVVLSDDDDDDDDDPRSYRSRQSPASFLIAAHGSQVGPDNGDRKQQAFVLHSYNDNSTDSWSGAPLNEPLNANIESFILNFDEADATAATLPTWNLDNYSSIEPTPWPTEFLATDDLATTAISRRVPAVESESTDDRSDHRFDDSLDDDIGDNQAVPNRSGHSDGSSKSGERMTIRKPAHGDDSAAAAAVGGGYISNDSLDSGDACGGWSEVRRGHRKVHLVNKPSVSSLENISDDSLADTSPHEQLRKEKQPIREQPPKSSPTSDTAVAPNSNTSSSVHGTKKAPKCHVSAKKTRMVGKSKAHKSKQL